MPSVSLGLLLDEADGGKRRVIADDGQALGRRHGENALPVGTQASSAASASASEEGNRTPPMNFSATC